MTRKEHEQLQEIRRMVTFESAHFRELFEDPVKHPLPKSETDVDAFIRERTRIFRETWILGPLDELLAVLPK
jgi:hypothetical protein